MLWDVRGEGYDRHLRCWTGDGFFGLFFPGKFYASNSNSQENKEKKKQNTHTHQMDVIKHE